MVTITLFLEAQLNHMVILIGLVGQIVLLTIEIMDFPQGQLVKLLNSTSDSVVTVWVL